MGQMAEPAGMAEQTKNGASIGKLTMTGRIPIKLYVSFSPWPACSAMPVPMFAGSEMKKDGQKKPTGQLSAAMNFFRELQDIRNFVQAMKTEHTGCLPKWMFPFVPAGIITPPKTIK